MLSRAAGAAHMGSDAGTVAGSARPRALQGVQGAAADGGDTRQYGEGAGGDAGEGDGGALLRGGGCDAGARPAMQGRSQGAEGLASRDEAAHRAVTRP
jgi:hypothetical protein